MRYPDWSQAGGVGVSDQGAVYHSMFLGRKNGVRFVACWKLISSQKIQWRYYSIMMMIFQQLFSMNFGGIPSWIIVEIPLLLKGGVAGHFPCMNENCERGKRSYLKSVVQLWLINVMARVVRWASEILGALSSSTSLIWLGISRILVIQWVCPFTSRFFSLHFDQQLLAAHQFLGLASWDTRHRKAFASATADGSMSFVRFFFVISHGLKKKIPITILTQR